jgi:hypothetical protein
VAESMNPYAEAQPTEKAIGTLFPMDYMPVEETDKDKRFKLIQYFAKRLGKSDGYVRARLKGMMDLETLYYIKSVCDQDEGRKYKDKNGEEKTLVWGQIFNQSLKV